jgi:hypothetical protein
MNIRIIYLLSTGVVLFAMDGQYPVSYNSKRYGELVAHQSVIIPASVTAGLTDPSGIIPAFMLDNNIDPENP